MMAAAASRPGVFRHGQDARRNVSTGRPPSARTILATIRRTLGRDAERICEQVRTLAAVGDPAAVAAAATLLSAVVQTCNRDVAPPLGGEVASSVTGQAGWQPSP